jgi:hypothetical protein
MDNKRRKRRNGRETLTPTLISHMPESVLFLVVQALFPLEIDSLQSNSPDSFSQLIRNVARTCNTFWYAVTNRQCVAALYSRYSAGWPKLQAAVVRKVESVEELLDNATKLYVHGPGFHRVTTLRPPKRGEFIPGVCNVSMAFCVMYNPSGIFETTPSLQPAVGPNFEERLYGDVDAEGLSRGLASITSNVRGTYHGYTQNSERHGIGIQFVTSDDVTLACVDVDYWGNWQHNKRHGLGVSHDVAGCKSLIGMYHNDKAYGIHLGLKDPVNGVHSDTVVYVNYGELAYEQ